ncbi:O-antigen ligase family protein [Xanthovirga aplysinae]|uniref:O-antigen ligase family protein n=1 Tax=Xanthovirga aplysinae TaxID=2529853 RepID=UPI0012BD3CCE|nr:O-antigen ligase family protein [Xanthovirga aplysinae]MTI31879.1 hypothetical protein [Xanthovirga aplysinae]
MVLVQLKEEKTLHQLFREKWYVFSLICVALTLPTTITLNRLAIIQLVICWLILPNLKQRFSINWLDPKLLVFVLFYFLNVLSLLFTQNMGEGLFALEKRASILLFPLLLSTSVRLKANEKTLIFGSFVVGYLLTSCLLLFHALKLYLVDGNTAYFFFHSLTRPIDAHAIYFAMFGIFSVGVLAHRLDQKWGMWDYYLKGLHLLVIGFLFMVIFLCASKMMMGLLVVFVIILLYRHINHWYGKHLKKLMLSFSLFFLTLFGAFMYFNEPIRERLKTGLFDGDYKMLFMDKMPIETRLNGVNLRLLIWKLGIKGIIKEGDFVFGFGPGDTQIHLNSFYIESELSKRGYLGYSAHNEYVQTFLELGLIGLLLLLVIFYFSFRYAYQYSGVVHFYFLFLLLFGFCTESMLAMNKGILYFSFFSSVFMFLPNNSSLLGPEINSKFKDKK